MNRETDIYVVKTYKLNFKYVTSINGSNNIFSHYMLTDMNFVPVECKSE